MCQVSVSTVTILTLEYVRTENYRHGTVIRIDELFKFSSFVRCIIHLVLIVVLIHISYGVIVSFTIICIFAPICFSRICTLKISNQSEYISRIRHTRVREIAFIRSRLTETNPAVIQIFLLLFEISRGISTLHHNIFAVRRIDPDGISTGINVSLYFKQHSLVMRIKSYIEVRISRMGNVSLCTRLNFTTILSLGLSDNLIHAIDCNSIGIVIVTPYCKVIGRICKVTEMNIISHITTVILLRYRDGTFYGNKSSMLRSIFERIILFLSRILHAITIALLTIEISPPTGRISFHIFSLRILRHIERELATHNREITTVMEPVLLADIKIALVRNAICPITLHQCAGTGILIKSIRLRLECHVSRSSRSRYSMRTIHKLKSNLSHTTSETDNAVKYVFARLDIQRTVTLIVSLACSAILSAHEHRSFQNIQRIVLLGDAIIKELTAGQALESIDIHREETLAIVRNGIHIPFSAAHLLEIRRRNDNVILIVGTHIGIKSRGNL